MDTRTLVAYPIRKIYRFYNCCLDISTLDKKGNGKCFGYLDIRKENFNKEENFRIISVLSIFVLPFITLGAIVYNLGRLLCVPIYVLGHIIKQIVAYNEEKVQFEVTDIF